MDDTRTQLFRALCAAQALGMGTICVLGLVAPHYSMSQMTGMEHAWDPATLSLMRMQTGGDIGLALGFALIAARPVSSLSALVLCATASVGHGIVHLLLAAHGGIVQQALMLSILIAGPLLLVAVYPRSQGVAFYHDAGLGAETRRRALQATCAIFGLMMIGIGAYGLLDPGDAMTLMAGEARDWDPHTLSLMQMHTAADIGLGIGLFATAYRPEASFPAIVLAIVASSAHGTVHVLEEVEGSHPSDNVAPLVILAAILVGLVVLTPWRAYSARYLAQE